jgi:hypothetical protein
MMDRTEALRIARKTIADAYELDFAMGLDGFMLAIPRDRAPNGLAKDRTHQEAADAYNLLATMHKEA